MEAHVLHFMARPIDKLQKLGRSVISLTLGVVVTGIFSRWKWAWSVLGILYLTTTVTAQTLARSVPWVFA